MEHKRNPKEVKALEYRAEHRYTYEDPHIERRSLPKRKQLRNQIYRSRVRRSLDEAIREAGDSVEEISPAKVIRGKSDRHGGALPLGEWLEWKHNRRISRAARNFFKQPYESQRDGERFVAFLVSLTEGQSEYSRELAEQFAGLLNGVDRAELKQSYTARFGPRYAMLTGRKASSWLQSFFEDKPEWEARLRAWIARTLRE